MFTDLRAHFKEWHVIKKAQSMPSDTPSQPRRSSSSGSVTADQRRRGAISSQSDARVPSPPQTTDARDPGNIDTSPKDHERDESNSHDVDNGLVSSSKAAEHLDPGGVDSTSSGSDDDFLGDFFPHILHEPHIPVPIAMVNRRPTGSEPFRPT